MKRHRWAKIFYKIDKTFDNLCYWRMVYMNMDERERNTIIATEKYREFCNDNYIEIEVKE